MKRRIGFLRFVYLYGAIFDGLTVVPMLSPAVGARMLGIADFQPGPDYRYAMGVAAALMTGWTALLVWGVFDPIARRGVMLLTAAPVLVGLIAAGVYAVTTGLVALPNMAPIFTFQVVGIALFVAGCQVARQAEASQTSRL